MPDRESSYGDYFSSLVADELGPSDLKGAVGLSAAVAGTELSAELRSSSAS
jgi:hypothetical protein